MAKYDVTGMSCAACQAHVEKAVNSVPGVDSCAVSLLTNSMTVEGSASPESIISAVENAGYGASLVSGKAVNSRDSLENKELPVIRNRLIASAVLLIILMIAGMDHMYVQMILALAILIINKKFFVSGFKAAIHAAPNMDTLVAMGSAVSFLYGYFESAAMIVTLITVGKLLESVSKGRTTNALKSLMDLAPANATVIRGDEEITVPIEEVNVGDIFAVKPGDKIPVDGIVIEGTSAVNEAALTGESVPADKEPGDRVSAATINQSGYLRCEATRVGEDTTLSQIIKLVSDSAATKAPIARIADKISSIFVPAVLIIAFIVTVIWLIAGQPLNTSITRGIAVLVVSCPCALGLATPVAIMAGNGAGARNGILFKNSTSLEQTGKINIAVLDKTGTITRGEPSVTDVFPASGISEDEFLKTAASLESKSEHPLARAVAAYAKAGCDCTDFQAVPGKGLTGTVNGVKVCGGNISFISSKTYVPEEALSLAASLSDSGKTPLLFTSEDKYLGLIAVADTIKDEAREAINTLHNMGIKTVMLTGDNERTANAVAKLAGVDTVVAGVLPQGKDKVIRELQKYGKVAMVGDGINDAPALTSADIGIAIGAGTDVAIDAADIVLVKSRLTDVPAAIRLSRKTVRNIHENLFWAFIYNILLIPVAAGALTGFGINMSPVLGAAAMSISSFTVCMNALRINLFEPGSTRYDKIGRNATELPQTIEGGNTTMATKTISIEGMMCKHCEKAVRNALMDIPGVITAEASHEAGNAVIEIDGDVTDEMITKTITELDYKVTGIN